MSFRIGQGYDVHPLVEGRRLVLGGEEIPFALGLEGFSDADVVLHALGDALLGAIGQGDIGSHFPPGDARWQDADSVELLRLIMDKVREQRCRVVNCDVTVVAEAPKLAPFREQIRQRIGQILEKRKDYKGASEAYARSLRIERNQPPIVDAKNRVDKELAKGE